jgi:SOS-response transcriptional repressor LexA
MEPNKKSRKGGYIPGSGRKKIPDHLKRKTKSRRISEAITNSDLKLLEKYKEHDLPLYEMEMEDGVPSITDKEKYETQKPADNLLIDDIEDHFLVKVPSGSNIEELGLLHKDTLLVNRNKKAGPDSIVIASNDNGKAVIKKFTKDGNRIKLTSSNKNCADMYIDESSYDRVWGVVTRVIRDFYDYDATNDHNRKKRTSF